MIAKKVDLQENINFEPERLKSEQKHELFEAIRHFSKYRAFENLSDACAMPESNNVVFEGICKLFEEHFETNADGKTSCKPPNCS